MSSDETEEHSLFEDLRRLAAEQPREARTRVAQLLDDQPKNLSRLLDLIGLPGEGRLRHLFANAVIEKDVRADALPQLRSWYDVETDEFTKKALRRALESMAKAPVEQSASVNNALVDQHFFEAYCYIQARLAHRVRNALLAPSTTIRKIRRRLPDVENDNIKEDLSNLVDELEGRFRDVGRIVEFNIDDDHFNFRRVVLHDWLMDFNAECAKNEMAINFEIAADFAITKACVRATPYLLQTIFWNLWTNAHQEVGENCRITVQMAMRSRFLQLIVLDNGAGLPSAARDAAFAQSYTNPTRRHSNSGVGLLEVREAVERLLGRVDTIEIDGRWFVMIEIPREFT